MYYIILEIPYTIIYIYIVIRIYSNGNKSEMIRTDGCCSGACPRMRRVFSVQKTFATWIGRANGQDRLAAEESEVEAPAPHRAPCPG